MIHKSHNFNAFVRLLVKIAEQSMRTREPRDGFSEGIANACVRPYINKKH